LIKRYKDVRITAAGQTTLYSKTASNLKLIVDLNTNKSRNFVNDLFSHGRKALTSTVH